MKNSIDFQPDYNVAGSQLNFSYIRCSRAWSGHCVLLMHHDSDPEVVKNCSRKQERNTKEDDDDKGVNEIYIL